MGGVAANTLLALPEDRFRDWGEIPNQFDRLFTASAAEMNRLQPEREIRGL
jgi:hypothetical protein